MTAEERRKVRLERLRNKTEKSTSSEQKRPTDRAQSTVEEQINKPAPLTRPREVKVLARAPRSKARVTIIERAYYETSDQTPTGEFNQGFSRAIPPGGQPYGPRHFTIEGSEWQALDLGWVESVGMIFLKNHDRTQTVELSFSSENPTAHQLIPPNEGLRLNPVDPKSLRIKVSIKSTPESPTESLGPCQCSVVVFPG